MLLLNVVTSDRLLFESAQSSRRFKLHHFEELSSAFWTFWNQTKYRTTCVFCCQDSSKSLHEGSQSGAKGGITAQSAGHKNHDLAQMDGFKQGCYAFNGTQMIKSKKSTN